MDKRQVLADEVLVLRCQLGDEAAFGRLVALYERKLRYYVRRLIGDTPGEDDVLQNTWLAVWTQLPRLRQTESFRPWLYRITRNTALQGLRRRREVVSLDENLAVPAEDGEGFSPDEAAVVHQALDRLTPAHREVLVLKFLEGMSYEDIANVLGCSLGTVRSRLHYGKKSLRETMEACRNER